MCKRKFKRILFVLVFIVSALFTIIATFPYSAFAADASNQNIMEKAMLSGLRQCMSSTYLNSDVYLGAHNLFDGNTFRSLVFTDTGKREDEDSVKLPTMVNNTIQDSAVGCSELLLGYPGIGNNDLAGFTVPTTLDAASKWLEALGYQKKASPVVESGDAYTQCASIEYKLENGNSNVTYTSNKLCFEVDAKTDKIRNENNQIVVTSGTGGDGGPLTFRQVGVSNSIELTTGCTYTSGLINKQTVDCPSSSILMPGGAFSPLYDYKLTDIQGWLDAYVSDLNYQGLCTSASSSYCDTYAKVVSFTVKLDSKTTNPSTDTSNYFHNDFPASAKDTATKFFSNNKYANTSASGFAAVDRYYDYTYTLFTLFGIKTDSSAGCKSSKSELPNPSLGLKIVAADGSHLYVQLDEATVNTAKSKKLGKLDAGTAFIVHKSMDSITANAQNIDTIIDWNNSLDLSGVSASSVVTVDPSTCTVSDVPSSGDYNPSTPVDADTTVSTDEDVNKACYTSTSLGWVLCPVLNITNKAVQAMYGIVEQELTVKPELLDSNTYDAWKIFQNFANIAIVILLLIVIFSQVTGVGIDNYGIKKTLPKIVIAAVLINLSFIACQLAADLSNIVGVDVNKLLSNIGSVSSENADIGTITKVISTVGAGAATVGAGAIAAFSWELWLVPLLLAIVGLLISVAFFFVILEVRKALIIMVIVIAPLAVVCYMLPNTKKWFDKWLSLLGALLVVFPICGLLMGGGQFVAKVLISVDDANFLFYLVAMLMRVIPFFFVPAILKGSMKGLGNVGAKISGIGSRVGGAAKRGLGGTERVKDAQRRLGMNRNLRTINRLGSRDSSQMSAYQKRRLNSARLAYNSAVREDLNAEAGGATLIPGTKEYDNYLEAQRSAENKQRLDNEIAALAGDTNNYDVDTMNKQLSDLMSKDIQAGSGDELKMRALMQKMATGSGYSKKQLAATVSSGSNASARSAAAKFMSKNGDVASAINSKNLAAGQYLRDVNSGATNQNFSDWKGATRAGTNMSNAQFVTSTVATKDADFVGQSAGAVRDSINTLSDGRLSQIVNNELLMDSENMDSDVRKVLVDEVTKRNTAGKNISMPSKYSAGNSNSGTTRSGIILNGSVEEAKRQNPPHNPPHNP